MDFVAFSWESVNIYWYGMAIGIAVIAGLAICRVNVWLYKEDFDTVVKIMVWAIPSSIIGARLVYVLQNMEYFAGSLADIFYLWQGGLSVYGALLAFFAVCIVYLRRQRLSVLYWLDLIMPSVVFGLMILQLVNFMMQFSVGMPLGIDLPNDHTPAEYIEYKFRPSGFEGYLYFQPVAFYQAVVHFCIFILTVLLTFVNKFFKLLNNGTIFLLALFLVALSRFTLGFLYFSVDRDVLLYPVQWIALVVMILSILFYIGKNFYRAKRF